MSDITALTSLNQRVWYVEGGVHPSRSPEFFGLGKFSADPAHTIGEDTKITAPDPNDFQRDIQVGTVSGSEERATLSIGSRYTAQKDILLNWKNRRCRVDIYALTGRCGNPQDFTEGGEKWVYFPDGRISSHSFENFGAYGKDENSPTNGSVDMTSEDYWEFLKMNQEQSGSATTVREIYTVDVYQGNSCEDCPDPCDRVLATMAGANATPGTQPLLLYSADGGDTWASQTISTLFSNEVVSDGAVIGGDIVYVSATSNSIHYTGIEDIYSGTNTWSETITGFVASKTPNAITSADARHSWICANGGYIYFVKNHKVEVEVQDAGVATVQNLNAIHAYDADNVLTVGNSNAVVYSTNAGETWQSVTGPAVGVNLGACWMWDPDSWFVGEGAGGTGKLWLTTNQGYTWSQVGLPSSTYVRVYKIVFVSEAEGYMIVTSGSQGYVLRTITAGNEWDVMPQGKKATAIANTYLRDLSGCSKYANTAYAAGLASNGTAGIILKMAAA
jgi:photosystem II stability/assembly factor-like uncharacterized protein